MVKGCQFCGKDIPLDTAIFCPYCKLNQTTGEPASSSKATARASEAVSDTEGNTTKAQVRESVKFWAERPRIKNETPQPARTEKKIRHAHTIDLTGLDQEVKKERKRAGELEAKAKIPPIQSAYGLNPRDDATIKFSVTVFTYERGVFATPLPNSLITLRLRSDARLEPTTSSWVKMLVRSMVAWKERKDYHRVDEDYDLSAAVATLENAKPVRTNVDMDGKTVKEFDEFFKGQKICFLYPIITRRRKEQAPQKKRGGSKIIQDAAADDSSTSLEEFPGEKPTGKKRPVSASAELPPTQKPLTVLMKEEPNFQDEQHGASSRSDVKRESSISPHLMAAFVHPDDMLYIPENDPFYQFDQLTAVKAEPAVAAMKEEATRDNEFEPEHENEAEDDRTARRTTRRGGVTTPGKYKALNG